LLGVLNKASIRSTTNYIEQGWKWKIFRLL
jgi:hypothetical protein